MNVLITGAASGIGFSLTTKLIKNGHFVYLCVHHDNEIEKVIEKIKNIDYQDRISVIKLDITIKKDRELIEKLDIDCLVNLAAIGIGGSLLNLEIKKIKENFNVNFFDTLELVKIYIKSRTNKHGKVIITSSLAGIIPIPFLGSYCATKASLSIMANVLRQEIKNINLNIKVKLVEPGAYYTGFNQIMIQNKEILNNKIFVEPVEKIIKKQMKLFGIVEKKNLNSIVNKMYEAVISENNKFLYRAPLSQIIGAKLYMILFK